MTDVSYVFMNSNTLLSYNANAEYVNISEFFVKSPTTNNYIMIKSEDANVIINASSNVNISSNVTFSANVSLVNTSLSVSTNNFTLGVSNTSANGYSTLPNGLLLQWGTVVSNTTVGDVTFTVPFTATLLSFTSTTATVNSAFNYTYTPVLIASNTTSANVRTSNVTAANVTWMAIGI